MRHRMQSHIAVEGASAIRLTEPQCRSLLLSAFSCFPKSAVYGARMPFFDTLAANVQVKSRPCLTFYSTLNSVEFVVPLFIGDLENEKYGISLKQEDYNTGFAGGYKGIDVTKCCTLPLQFPDGEPTFWDWNPEIVLKNASDLRDRVIQKLVQMLDENPLQYADPLPSRTCEVVETAVLRDGEYVWQADVRPPAPPTTCP